MTRAKQQAETLRQVANELDADAQLKRNIKQARVEGVLRQAWDGQPIHRVDTVPHNEQMRYTDFDAQKVARSSAGRQLAEYFAQRMEWESVDAIPGGRDLRFYGNQTRFRASVIAMSPAEFRRILREVAERAAGLR